MSSLVSSSAALPHSLVKPLLAGEVEPSADLAPAAAAAMVGGWPSILIFPPHVFVALFFFAGCPELGADGAAADDGAVALTVALGPAATAQSTAPLAAAAAVAPGGLVLALLPWSLEVSSPKP
jgi:hypothetical protein